MICDAGKIYLCPPMKKLFISLLAFSCWLNVSAQVDTLLVQDRNPHALNQRGSVVIFEDQRITALMDTLKVIDIPIEGYRIQLSFGKKEEVHEIRTDFLKDYPEMGAYISWLQPNFRLRVGDFRTRLEAERFKNEILESHPNCYIVRDQIEAKRIED